MNKFVAIQLLKMTYDQRKLIKLTTLATKCQIKNIRKGKKINYTKIV